MKIKKTDLKWIGYGIARMFAEFGIGATIGYGTYKWASQTNKIIGMVLGVICAGSSSYMASDILEEYLFNVVEKRLIEEERCEDFLRNCTIENREET